ncbi:MAG: P1 family peptidase [Clostridiales bacterium]
MKEIKINEIPGFQIGNAENKEGGTGCTAVVCPKGAYAGMDSRGGSPATRETTLLNPINTVEQVHCVMLSGGSAFGLAAADGAMEYLEEHGIGFDVGITKVPIVPSACIFDLVVGDFKCRPDKAMGYEALENAEKNNPAQGNFGAGCGGTVGKLFGPERAMKSGLGFYAVEVDALKVGAIVAVNALGNIVDVENGEFMAGLLSEDKTSIISTKEAIYALAMQSFNVFKGNTTVGCIITNAKLTKSQCSKVASMAHNGYARAIYPVHTPADGDTIFAMAHGEVETMVDVVGSLAADVMAKAINNAVRNAESAYGFKAYGDLK